MHTSGTSNACAAETLRASKVLFNLHAVATVRADRQWVGTVDKYPKGRSWKTKPTYTLVSYIIPDL